MASLFQRDRSPYWWVKFRGCDGSIHRESTMMRLDSSLETRKAKEIAMLRGIEELKAPGLEEAKSRHLSVWVPQWIEASKGGSTRERYRQVWVALNTFFVERKIIVAEQITRGHCLDYFAVRKGGIAGLSPVATNTALMDLRILRAILYEALRREWILVNPASRLGIKPDKSKEKAEFTSEDIERVRKALPDKKAPMRIAFEIALHQGCRLRETSMPLDRIDLVRGTISFRIKGDREHVTLLHPELRPLIEEISERGECLTYPWDPLISRDFSRLFKTLKMRKRGICFHSTRVTAITRLARSGSVSQQQAMRFIGHSTAAVHKIYQRLGAADLEGCLTALSSGSNLLSETRGASPAKPEHGTASSPDRNAAGSQP
jgi:integrase